MKLTEDQILDIVTIGEAKAIQQNAKSKLYLIDKEPKEEKDGEDTYKELGFLIEFRPEPEKVTKGLSTVILDTFEICQWWAKLVEGKWVQDHLEMGLTEFLGNNIEWKDRDYNLWVSKKTYESWEPFAKDMGITELVTISTKVPKPFSLKFQKFCEASGETPSWRLRMLIEDYLTEKIKDQGRLLLFS